MSNTERQRQFRERNPGYYGRLKARERAASKACVQAMLAAKALAAEKVAAEAKVAEALAVQRQPLMLPAPAPVQLKPQLLLPAPVERIEIPGFNMIPTREQLEARRAAREAVPIYRREAA